MLLLRIGSSGMTGTVQGWLWKGGLYESGRNGGPVLCLGAHLHPLSHAISATGGLGGQETCGDTSVTVKEVELDWKHRGQMSFIITLAIAPLGCQLGDMF